MADQKISVESVWNSIPNNYKTILVKLAEQKLYDKFGDVIKTIKIDTDSSSLILGYVLVEQDKKRQEDEEKRRQEDEEKRRQDEEKRRQDEEKRRQDEEKRRQDEEKRRQEDEEKRRQDEEKRLQDEEKRRQYEEKRQEDEEKRRQDDEKRQEDEEKRLQDEKKRQANAINIDLIWSSFDNNTKALLKNSAAEGSDSFQKIFQRNVDGGDNIFYADKMRAYILQLISEQDIEETFKERTTTCCGKEVYWKTIALNVGLFVVLLGIGFGIAGCVIKSRVGIIMTNISAMFMAAGTGSVAIFVMLYLVAHQVRKIENAANNQRPYQAVSTTEDDHKNAKN